MIGPVTVIAAGILALALIAAAVIICMAVKVARTFTRSSDTDHEMIEGNPL